MKKYLKNKKVLKNRVHAIMIPATWAIRGCIISSQANHHLAQWVVVLAAAGGEQKVTQNKYGIHSSVYAHADRLFRKGGC